MMIHELKGNKKKTKRRVGRGGKRGTFSGRGTKGQKARSGRRIRPQSRDILKKIPKRRGRGKHSLISIRQRPEVVNVGRLEKHFQAGEIVTPQILAEKKLIALRGKRVPGVKLLGTGALTKNLLVSGCQVSGSAREKIERAGGSVAQIK